MTAAPKQYRDFTEILASLSESAQNQLVRFQKDLLELPEAARQEFSLVLRATLKFVKRGKSRGFSAADLFQEGALAFIQANKVCQLVDATGRACYVSKAVTRHLKRALDGATPLYYPRQLRRDRTLVNKASRSLTTRASRSLGDGVAEVRKAARNVVRHGPSALAVAKEAGLSVKRVAAVLEAATARFVPLEDVHLATADEALQEDPRLPVAQAQLALLPERERRIVELHLGLDGQSCSFAEIASDLRISKTYAQKLYQAAIGKIRSACNTTVH